MSEPRFLIVRLGSLGDGGDVVELAGQHQHRHVRIGTVRLHQRPQTRESDDDLTGLVPEGLADDLGPIGGAGAVRVVVGQPVGRQPGRGEHREDDRRLRALVDYAHRQGFWIRFYTIDGFLPGEDRGWGNAYNFGSHDAAAIRWKAAIDAGVNLIATNQYEELARAMK